MALKFLDAQKIKTKTVPIILSPFATRRLLYNIIAPLNAESIQHKRSCFTGKKGEQIANPLLTIVDNPLIPGGVFSSVIDGEGVARRKQTIIDKGIIKTYLHNSYTSNKSKEENTANASRGNYRSGVYISPTNLIPELGTVPAAELIKNVKDGVYVYGCGFSPNANGDISSTIDFGYWIKDGELAFPIKNAMIGTTIFELLNNIEAISSDYVERPGQILPTIKINNIRVSGAK